jgi:hypothetical protein
VKIDCEGLEPSDYKKIGAKLKVLIPHSYYVSMSLQMMEIYHVCTLLFPKLKFCGSLYAGSCSLCSSVI